VLRFRGFESNFKAVIVHRGLASWALCPVGHYVFRTNRAAFLDFPVMFADRTSCVLGVEAITSPVDINVRNQGSASGAICKEVLWGVCDDEGCEQAQDYAK
jgi:hypothetical protein